ncbi:unnamed protein product [Lampetra planeri]
MDSLTHECNSLARHCPWLLRKADVSAVAPRAGGRAGGDVATAGRVSGFGEAPRGDEPVTRACAASVIALRPIPFARALATNPSPSQRRPINPPVALVAVPERERTRARATRNAVARKSRQGRPRKSTERGAIASRSRSFVRRSLARKIQRREVPSPDLL